MLLWYSLAIFTYFLLWKDLLKIDKYSSGDQRHTEGRIDIVDREQLGHFSVLYAIILTYRNLILFKEKQQLVVERANETYKVL